MMGQVRRVPWHVAGRRRRPFQRHHFRFSKPHPTMGKKTSNKRGKSSRDASTWSSSDHELRKAKRQRKLNEKHEEREMRTALLTRDSKEKRDEGKLRLHIVRIKRQVEQLRTRLETWDDIEEEQAKIKKEKEEMERKRKEEEPKKKWVRPGPETWKLKGVCVRVRV